MRERRGEGEVKMERERERGRAGEGGGLPTPGKSSRQGLRALTALFFQLFRKFKVKEKTPLTFASTRSSLPIR